MAKVTVVLSKDVVYPDAEIRVGDKILHFKVEKETDAIVPELYHTPKTHLVLNIIYSIANMCIYSSKNVKIEHFCINHRPVVNILAYHMEEWERRSWTSVPKEGVPILKTILNATREYGWKFHER